MNKTNKTNETRASSTLITMLVLTSLLFVFILLYRCHFGIDLTDEGLYLNLISNPWLYKISVSQFGYIYHPLYQLVGENIVRLRQADMLIMLGLAWIVCTQLLFFVLTNPKKTTTYPNAYIYGLSFALATCVFTFFGVPFLGYIGGFQHQVTTALRSKAY